MASRDRPCQIWQACSRGGRAPVWRTRLRCAPRMPASVRAARCSLLCGDFCARFAGSARAGSLSRGARGMLLARQPGRPGLLRATGHACSAFELATCLSNSSVRFECCLHRSQPALPPASFTARGPLPANDSLPALLLSLSSSTSPCIYSLPPAPASFRPSLQLVSPPAYSAIPMSLCPPPRMPSPQLIPAPLPSPPPFPRRISSRSRLQLPLRPNEPPVPPRLVGSALLERLINPDPATLTPKIQKQLWFDGDEFGTQRASPALSDDSTGSTCSSASTPSTSSSASSRRAHRRTPSVSLAHRDRARSHSPPPPQQLSVSIPPVPPIPSSAFDSPGAKRSTLRTPPATPGRARPMQIIIPDLTNPPSFGGSPAPALRHTPRTSRTSTSASPRRRGAGAESH